MRGLVLARSNLKCPCNFTSSPLQFVLYLLYLNRPGSGLVMPCFGPWHLVLLALPHLPYLYLPCHDSI